MSTNVISKRMAYVLRHGAVDLGLSVDAGGYVLVTDLLALTEFQGVTLSQLQSIVENDTKGRYSMTEDSSRIRANQGHSFPVQEEELLTPVSDASEIPVCIHGTYKRFLPSIRAEGLRRMSRQHIHFASGKHARSGMRRDVQVLIYVDVARAMADGGIKFFVSSNGVILSSGLGDTGAIPPEYFAEVVEL